MSALFFHLRIRSINTLQLRFYTRIGAEKIHTRIVLLTVSALTICAQKKFVLTSPDGVLKAYISIGKEITYSVTHGTDTVLFQSAIAMQLDKGRTFGIASRLSGHNEKAVRQYLKSPFYKKKEIEDHYNLIHLKFKNGLSLIVKIKCPPARISLC